MADKVYKTRIALKIDKESNWIANGCKKPLLEGEIGMSYGDAQWDAEKKTYVYKSFKFKVGARDHITGALLTWDKLEEVNIGTLSPDEKEQLIAEITERLKDQFVLKSSFEEFKTLVMDNAVTDWEVKSEKLSLIKGLSSLKTLLGI